MNMKIAALFGALLLWGCHQSQQPQNQTCYFIADTLKSDAPELDLTVDSSRTYSYQYAQSNPDSILQSLCAKSIEVSRAFNDADYLCKDMIGPRFVVVLVSPDPKILSENFQPGNGGRFGCATKVVRYRQVIAVE
jgi:hypothetical protein